MYMRLVTASERFITFLEADIHEARAKDQLDGFWVRFDEDVGKIRYTAKKPAVEIGDRIAGCGTRLIFAEKLNFVSQFFKHFLG